MDYKILLRNNFGRGDWIRTSDRSAPSRVLYQAELLPDRTHSLKPTWRPILSTIGLALKRSNEVEMQSLIGVGRHIGF